MQSDSPPDRLLLWQQILETLHVGNVVLGRVTRRIRGGVIVDLGVPAYLSEAEANVPVSGDIKELVDQDIRAIVIEIDKSRRAIILSQRRLP